MIQLRERIKTITLRKDMPAAWILATGSLCVGLMFNQLRDQPIPLVYQSKEDRLMEAVQRVAAVDSRPENRTMETLPEYIELEVFRSYVEEKQGLVLDARPELFHRLGHVPGALSLPRDDFENAYATLRAKLEENKNQPLVIYCSSASCEDAGLVRRALQQLGYTNTTVFKAGWNAWTSADLPTGGRG